jgi:pyruvate/2-oxoglutarate dehydrogenase complex dihydrolipoamide dehydrogenase (E3) component
MTAAGRYGIVVIGGGAAGEKGAARAARIGSATGSVRRQCEEPE